MTRARWFYTPRNHRENEGSLMTTDPPGIWSECGGIWTVESPGETSVAIVSCLHGDETCGKRAIERVVGKYGEIEGVKFVVANPRAYAKEERYIDDDLNRMFSDEGDSDSYERRLAAELSEELQGHDVLDLHSTESTPTPFALFQNRTEEVYEAVKDTGIQRVVDIGFVEGGMIGHLNGISVEFDKVDLQKATDEAYEVIVRYLANKGYIGADSNRSDPTLYRITDRIPKESEGFEVVRTNFTRVEEGELFARRQEGIARPYDAFYPLLTVRADEQFYPVLVSDQGYDDIYGFKASCEGLISESAKDFGAQETEVAAPGD